jgi:two-component system sensor histidine kinase YcbA
MVVVLRILFDWAFFDKMLADSFLSHYPTFFYYLTFGGLFYALKMNRQHHRPLYMGALGIMIEISSSLAEITFQYLAFGAHLTLSGLHTIVVIAIFRSYFAIGFFNLLKLYRTRTKIRQTRKQNARLLMIISSLYEETIHLKKTLRDSERITKDAYFLYQKLKEAEGQLLPLNLSAAMLKMVGEIHEIKKDNQRIYAGLAKLISDESYTEYMNIHELMKIIIRTNHKYALSLGKEIEFIPEIKGNHPDYHIYRVLSLFNNLVMNAIEAIKKSGSVKIGVHEQQHYVHFHIQDNGPGIPNRKKDLIFEPGFTSKYETDGSSSTGIGLSYVKTMVEELDGIVMLQSIPEVNGTLFTIELPIHNLTMKG